MRSIACDPGLIDLKDLPDFRKPRERPAISTKLPSLNAITDDVKTTTMPSTASTWDGYHSVKLTHEDVVTGSNSVYGSQQQMQQIPNGGGIIFAISPGQAGQGSSSQPLMSAGELMSKIFEYLTKFPFSSTPASADAISFTRGNASTSVRSIHSTSQANHDGSSSTVHASEAAQRATSSNDDRCCDHI